MPELDSKTHNRIKKLCAKADKLALRQKYVKAQKLYSQALDALPEPRAQWNATNWIMVAQMDAAFLNGDISIARELLDLLATWEENIGNPFFHLRNGQVYFLQEEDDKAADQLIRAYALEGVEIFEIEEPKYLEFLKTKAKL